MYIYIYVQITMYNVNYMYKCTYLYEFTSSDTNRTTFAFNACFVWKPPLADERKGFFRRISIASATIDAIEHVFNVANSHLALRSCEVACQK
jgi:hypothetical protein